MAGSQNYLTESLRDYLVDLEDFNLLNLKQEELLDAQLKKAVLDGAQAYDLIPPLSTTNVDTFTEANIIGPTITGKLWYIIKQYATIEAIQLLIKINIRNRNRINDQGFQVEEFGKADEWAALRRIMKEEVNKTARDYKRALEYASFGSGGSLTVSLDRRSGEMG